LAQAEMTEKVFQSTWTLKASRNSYTQILSTRLQTNLGQTKDQYILIKEILLEFQAKIDLNIRLVGEFNTSLSTVSRLSEQNFNKEASELNDTIDQMDIQICIEYFI
jgi:hypothetical protein